MRTLADALDLVSPFVSTDETRPHLCKPARYAGHVVATDGHTLACSRYDGAGADPARELDQGRTPPPPWQAVLPARLTCLGEIARSAVLPLAHYPAKWKTLITLCGEYGGAHVDAEIPARTGRHGKVLAPKIVMVKRSALEGFAEIKPEDAIGIAAEYFVRCFECATGFATTCYVHAAGPLLPVVFAPEVCRVRDDLYALPQFAITMPVRL